ncbi:MAG TPA: lysine-sensitive aspartokinase 3 [Bacteroidota bacterium]
MPRAGGAVHDHQGFAMLVMKFGGTSVEDAAAMRNVATIVCERLERRPVVVASACARVTNTLLALARTALTDAPASLAMVEQLRGRHRGIAADLFQDAVLETVTVQVDAMMDVLRDLVKSIAILGELTDRSLDTFASFGEKLSTLILTGLFKQEGMDAILVNAQEVVITSDDYTRAVPITEEILPRARKLIGERVNAGHLVVTQGFLGATRQGIATTIGRGGSDYSAAILGAALEAEEIQIWTDVDGMMTSDPSKIPTARLIPEMTFREAAELAYFGAKVLHPSTILPAVQKNIPVRILNSRRPHVPGTVIVAQPTAPSQDPVIAIANKRGVTLVTITSTRMLMMHGFLARVFEIFARFERSVDVIATSEVSISLTLDSENHLEEILKELGRVADVEVEHDKAIFCVVGENLRRSRGTLTAIFGALEKHDIPVGMISLGASEINVTFVVNGSDAEKTAQVLHHTFFAP